MDKITYFTRPRVKLFSEEYDNGIFYKTTENINVCHEKYWKNVITWGDSDVCYRVKLKQ
jgi:hypothetical protein